MCIEDLYAVTCELYLDRCEKKGNFVPMPVIAPQFTQALGKSQNPWPGLENVLMRGWPPTYANKPCEWLFITIKDSERIKQG